MRDFPQRTRLWLALGYAVLLVLVARAAFGSWLLPPGPDSFWLYASLAVLVLGVFIDSPFYVTPAQALSGSVLGLFGLIGVAPAFVPEVYDQFGLYAWWIAAGLTAVVFLLAFAAIATKDSARPQVVEASNLTRAAAAQIGAPVSLFSLLFFFAVVAFHRLEASELLALGGLWATLVVIRPLERSVLAARWIRARHRTTLSPRALGRVIAYEFPRIITVRHGGPADVPAGQVLAVPGADGRGTLALSLNYIGQADGAWLRALQLEVPESTRRQLPRSWVRDQQCMILTMEADTSLLKESDGIKELVRRRDLVATVSANSDVVRLHCEVVRPDGRLQQGGLLEVDIGDKPVLYQILNGVTREEFLQQKHTRGFVQCEAQKVGHWDSKRFQFVPSRWVPAPNSPVYAVSHVDADPQPGAVGHFPGTNLPVSIDTKDLVTHNAAILGILGVGKTFLALELVERMIADGIKVICLDLTDQYAQELQPFFVADAQERLCERLNEIGRSGKANVSKHVEEGGSVREFRAALSDSLEKFLSPDNEAKLLVLNPNRFEVWRQDSKPFKEEASMASLTPAEITRLFAELALETLQAQGMAESARCCLVLEEAHSLIPEWNAVAADGDRAATIGTARAILQGRKYGFGCLVVTQRTASVTKTILNQCNTVFAMRVFDATGMDFLANYIGNEYAGVLSGLPERHAVVFGKASSCADPVQIRVNDRADFLRIFRQEAERPEALEGAPLLA